MTDIEEDGLSLPDQRKLLTVQQKAAGKLKKRLQRMMDSEDPATLDLNKLQERDALVISIVRKGTECNDILVEAETDETLQDEDEAAWDLFTDTIDMARKICQELISLRTVSSLAEEVDSSLNRIQTEQEDNPMMEYLGPISDVHGHLTELKETLRASTIPASHILWSMSKEFSLKLDKLQATKVVTSTVDTKPPIKPESTNSGYKRAHLTIPKFSGELKDWHPFWNGFREAVHDATDLKKSVKLSYLKESMKDKALWRMLSRATEDEDYYDQAVQELKERFDKPREMHRIYVNNVLNIGQVKSSQSSLTAFADTLRESLDGLR